MGSLPSHPLEMDPSVPAFLTSNRPFQGVICFCRQPGQSSQSSYALSTRMPLSELTPPTADTLLSLPSKRHPEHPFECRGIVGSEIAESPLEGWQRVSRKCQCSRVHNDNTAEAAEE